MSQISESALSDIIPDVDRFIEEENIANMTHFFQDINHAALDEHDYKLPFVPIDIEDPPAELPQRPLEMNYPPRVPVKISDEEYPGPLDFEVYIVPSDQKTPWEYSAKLNKIFIQMGPKFPVAFGVKRRLYNQYLFVRITPAFSQSQHFQELVHRCLGHEHAHDSVNKDLPLTTLQHIMRCNNLGARYFGDINNGERLSIVIPLAVPQAGSDTVKEYFQFVCKNSCPTGMNRRPIEVIFTLENESGEVLGRRAFCVRICSCPKRDRLKEENELAKSSARNNENRVGAPAPLAPPAAPPVTPARNGKKRRLGEEASSDASSDGEKKPATQVDDRMIPVNFTIVGRNNYRKLMELAHTLVAADIVKSGLGPANSRNHRKCLADLDAMLRYRVSHDFFWQLSKNGEPQGVHWQPALSVMVGFLVQLRQRVKN